jgi:predicted nucleic acid-binding protein
MPLLVESPSAIQVLPTGIEAGLLLLDLVAEHKLTARRVHDARHTATALVAGATRVYTYDVTDWRVFASSGIEVTGPGSVLR